MLCGDLNGKEIRKRGDICKHIGDSLRCTAEANILSNCTPIKIKKEKDNSSHFSTKLRLGQGLLSFQ